ncbi:hypothetical protein [Oleisolibacter albus]|uniref:hypothetical protein n=1 Tax=Oleisolibacter albus TaxID=2171757 RepID=UPI000DF4A156|nr:hypothetical protein [Oleisolibacter albus]
MGRNAPDRELTVKEMLADPIVQILMRRDGVRQDDVLAALHRRPLIGLTRQHTSAALRRAA